MGFFTRLVTYFTLGSSKPIRRLAAYYVLLGIVGYLAFHFLPMLDGVLTGERRNLLATTPTLLQDALPVGAVPVPAGGLGAHLAFTVSTLFVLLSTLALMLPVTWVYMSA